jgi:beta-phosphoglucomutase-like phosphatase (HAD superfamily)
VVVEDAPAGIRSAHVAGMRVIAVTTTHSRAELGEADVGTERLTQIHISPGGVGMSTRFTVRVTGVRLEDLPA